MKKLLYDLVFIPFILISFSCSSNDTIASSGSNQKLSNTDKQVASSSNLFGINLINDINKTEADSNIFISPLSVSTALGMTLNGAKGETYTQMKNTLQLPGSNQDEVNQSYQNLNNILSTADPNVSFTTANSVWCKQGLSFEQSFLNVNKQYFNAEVQSLNFLDPASVNVINNWVSNNTKGKITSIIGSIPSDVIMYLINAIYFNATWTNKFDSTKTTATPFYLANGGTVQCAMMNQENKFNYYLGSNYSALQLPYGNGNFNMLVILPNSGVDVNQLLSQVNASMLSQINTGATKQDVKLYLPRFQVSYFTSLKYPLIDLGMIDAFGKTADFSNISNTMPLSISDVLHKTYVKVGEEGTEAAAVTAVIVATSVIIETPPVIEFNVNHPFIFLITEKNSGSILFAGKIMNPVN